MEPLQLEGRKICLQALLRFQLLGCKLISQVKARASQVWGELESLMLGCVGGELHKDSPLTAPRPANVTDSLNGLG